MSVYTKINPPLTPPKRGIGWAPSVSFIPSLRMKIKMIYLKRIQKGAFQTAL